MLFLFDREKGFAILIKSWKITFGEWEAIALWGERAIALLAKGRSLP